MIDIPSNDFNLMQSQAIRYAREMQQRASPAQNQNCPPPLRNPSPPKPETPFCKAACPVKNILGMGNNDNKDNDILLLMALILVLSADGGDRMLMMALLYIMT